MDVSHRTTVDGHRASACSLCQYRRLRIGLENFPSEKCLHDCCLGLIVFHEGTSSVRLVHKTLQEYLKKQYDLGHIFQKGHGEIVQVCLGYMSFHEPIDSMAMTDQTMKVRANHFFPEFPFLEYSLSNWGHHTAKQPSRDEEVEQFAIDLMLDHGEILSKCISKCLYIWPISCTSDLQPYRQSDKSCALHVMTYFNLQYSVETLIKHFSFPINESNTPLIDYGTPLQIVAEFDFTAAAQILLAQDDVVVNIYSPDNGITSWRNGPPLLKAVYNNHEDIVRLLLSRDEILGNLVVHAKRGLTLLHYAIATTLNYERSTESYHVRTRIIRMLVEKKDININTCGSWGNPLISAIENGQDEVVQCLLEREDCDINTRTVPDGATTIISVCAAQDHQEWHANTL